MSKFVLVRKEDGKVLSWSYSNLINDPKYIPEEVIQLVGITFKFQSGRDSKKKYYYDFEDQLFRYIEE